MKKITLSIIMIVLTISAAVSVSAETAQDFSWKLTDGVLTISGSGDMPNYGGDAPWASQCSEIKEVVILQGVTSIGDWAFYNCDSLTSVSIPEGVTSIGYDAFRDCSSLTNIEVAENNLSYSSENGVLYNKNKTVLIQYAIGKSNMEFIIPEGVTSIGRGAFSGCSSLTNIEVAENNLSYSSEKGVLYDKNKTVLIQYAIGKSDIGFIIPEA